MSASATNVDLAFDFIILTFQHATLNWISYHLSSYKDFLRGFGSLQFLVKILDLLVVEGFILLRFCLSSLLVFLLGFY